MMYLVQLLLKWHKTEKRYYFCLLNLNQKSILNIGWGQNSNLSLLRKGEYPISWGGGSMYLIKLSDQMFLVSPLKGEILDKWWPSHLQDKLVIYDFTKLFSVEYWSNHFLLDNISRYFFLSFFSFPSPWPSYI